MRKIWQGMTTPEKIEAIKAAYVTVPVVSASEIAAALPGKVSRNAVIGMYERWGGQLQKYPLQRPSGSKSPGRRHVIPGSELTGIRRMVEEGMSVAQIADVYDCTTETVRRALERKPRKTPYVPSPKYRPEASRVHDHAIRISDSPTSVTGALFGDPSPERLKYIHGKEIRP